MRRSIIINKENEAIWTLLENKSQFVNEKLEELHDAVIRRRKVYENNKCKFAKQSHIGTNSALISVVIDSIRYNLSDYDINPTFLLAKDDIDELLAIVLMKEKLEELKRNQAYVVIQ
jgi:uncharacterized FAD-dependent dehydrogenase